MSNSQAFAGEISWTQDWTKHIVDNGNAFVITSASAASLDDRVTVANETVTGNGTGVTFAVSQVGITEATTVVVRVSVVLSNGDTDYRDFEVQFTNT